MEVITQWCFLASKILFQVYLLAVFMYVIKIQTKSVAVTSV